MVVTILAILMFVTLAVGCTLVISGTVMKNRWGINTGRVNCPTCGHSFDRVRTPKNLAQVLWGGVTCDKCGTQLDKWGRPVAQHNSPKPSP